MSEQQYTSAGTSLNQVPALHRWYHTRRGYGAAGAALVVDIGAGRYDAAGEHIEALGVEYLPFDPYNRTEGENNTARAALDIREADVLCANVLNVIAEPEHRAGVIALAARCTGRAYFAVYEGDRSGVGRPTTRGYQNNRKTHTYMDELRAHFKHVHRDGATVLVCWN